MIKQTEEQKAQGRLIREKWYEYALCTDPTDIDAVTRSMEVAYKAIDKPRPPVCFVKSPQQAQRALKLMADTNKYDEATVREAATNPELPLPKDPNMYLMMGRQHAYWCCFYEYLRDIIRYNFDPAQLARIESLLVAGQTHFWWWPNEEVVVVSQNPTRYCVSTTDGTTPDPDNAAIVVHCDDGPAFAFEDGYEAYALEGHAVSKAVVERKITPDMVKDEVNAEIRRIMLERYPGGQGKYLLDIQAEVLDVDHSRIRRDDPESPTIVRALVRAGRDLFMATTDGSTGREYHLNVDPDLDELTCKAAHESMMPEGVDESKVKYQS